MPSLGAHLGDRGTRSLGPLLVGSVAGLALLHAGSQLIATNDLHIYLAMGREMAHSGQLLQADGFTWTAAGVPFVNGTWGWSLLSWGVFQQLGLPGLRILTGLCVAAAVLFSSLGAHARGADVRAAAFAGLYAWALMLQNVSVRSQTLVFPLMALLLWACGRRRRALGALGLGLLTGALWANLHGSFPAGLVALGGVFFGRLLQRQGDLRTPALLAAGLLLGACVGPYGPELWLYVFDNTAMPRGRGFSEWAPPTLRSFEGARFFGALALWAVIMGLRRRLRPAEDWVLLLGFAFLALSGLRFVAWFGLATAPAFGRRLSALLPQDQGLPSRWVTGLNLSIAALWILLLPKGLQPRTQELAPETPVHTTAALAGHAPGGRLLNAPEYGGYVNLTLGSSWETSGDVRTWVFDDPAWAVFVDLSRAPDGWEQRLDELGVTHLLLRLDYHSDGLVTAARTSSRWALLAEDEHSAAFVRAAGNLGPFVPSGDR